MVLTTGKMLPSICQLLVNTPITLGVLHAQNFLTTCTDQSNKNKKMKIKRIINFRYKSKNKDCAFKSFFEHLMVPHKTMFLCRNKHAEKIRGFL